MRYEAEKNVLMKAIKQIYQKYSRIGISNVVQKTQFDLVTDIDCGIERELTEIIHNSFPQDKIHGEETSNDQIITERTWTIDPIDGTCNMASSIPLYGVQCALFENFEVVFSIIYLPHFCELLFAEQGEGCFLNGRRVFVKQNSDINNAIVSFGDYPHLKVPDTSLRQHKAIGFLYPRIAKIRMFGAACIDFSSVASGRTDGTVVITKNLWDIAPGILMCKEAGALLTNLDGKPYRFGDNGVVVASSPALSTLIAEAFRE